MKEWFKRFAQFLYKPSPPTLMEQMAGGLQFTAEEHKRYQQLISDPVMVKAMQIVYQQQPSLFGVDIHGQDITNIEKKETRIFWEARGFVKHHHALVLLAKPIDKKDKKQIKENYQEPGSEFKDQK